MYQSFPGILSTGHGGQTQLMLAPTRRELGDVKKEREVNHSSIKLLVLFTCSGYCNASCGVYKQMYLWFVLTTQRSQNELG